MKIYVDDNIFGSPNITLHENFFNLMKGESEMSLMGEITLFFGLQIKQTKVSSSVKISTQRKSSKIWYGKRKGLLNSNESIHKY